MLILFRNVIVIGENICLQVAAKRFFAVVSIYTIVGKKNSTPIVEILL